MCFVLLRRTGLCAILMALLLSQRRGTLLQMIPKSLRVCLIQSSWAQQLAAAMYSASAVDRETQFCCLDDQHTKDLPRNWQAPEVDFRLTLSPAQSESEYPTRSKLAPLGYQSPKFGV